MRQILDGSELLGFQKLLGRRVDPNVLKSVGYPRTWRILFPVILIVADEPWTCVEEDFYCTSTMTLTQQRIWILRVIDGKAVGDDN
ncbi:hypothetical protein TNCV_2994751 [Trichonephila clavipes]|nr:hypothetical protein TNCV_2994751 [Trichonephila clavipes]